MAQWKMPVGSGLAKVLSATTLEAIRVTGGVDAVVVGSGAAGGLAALLLTEAGLRVLVLEAGPSRGQRSVSRWLTTNAVRLLTGPLDLRSSPAPLSLIARAALTAAGWWRQPIQSRCRQWIRAPEIFVDDLDCPYVTPRNRPFVWVRARALGGRMLVPGHGWQYYRLGPDDFTPTDGLSPAWPLKVGELDQWYTAVERRLKLTGGHDGLSWLPDSELSHLLEPSANQLALQQAIADRWPDARSVVGRFARPVDALEAAAMTGRLLCRQGAIAREILVDSSGRAHGIVWIDQQSGTTERLYAPLIFVCASTLESTRLLLLSRSAQSPHGLGAASGVLGCGLMDHITVSAMGLAPPLAPGADREQGRCLYLPRFDARTLSKPAPGRGFGVQVYQFSSRFGALFFAVSFGEMIPRSENRVILDPTRRDAWNIPVLRIECGYNQSELLRAREQATALRELAETARVSFTTLSKVPAPPGSAIHECGTARMGTDPSNSVLDPYNQCWEARGLYLTDGASFPSLGPHNTTLTILALTARACDHAIRNAR
jgi:choline dehydrogenase-like flavoprotein